MNQSILDGPAQPTTCFIDDDGGQGGFRGVGGD